MQPNNDKLKQQIVLASQKLWQRGLVANHDGNITVKCGPGFLATPTAFSKGDITERDILTLNASGEVVDGLHKVFSEISWHLALYRARPDINCIVHAHPPKASGFGIAHAEIGVPAIPEAIVSLGSPILTTAFISPLDSTLNQNGGSVEQEFRKALAQSDACIVPGNGCWCVGQDVLQTYYRVELLEHLAHQHLAAREVGEIHRLPHDLVEALLKKRPIVSAKPLPSSSQDLPRASTSVPSQAPNSAPISVHPLSEKKKVDLSQIRDVVRAQLESLFK